GMSQSLNPGSNTLTFAVPETTVQGSTYARFRLSNNGDLLPTGFAPDGEVEDYPVAPIPELSTIILMSMGLLSLGGIMFWRRKTRPQPVIS
ncbi:MAG: GEVED domain-containing protein, partial [Chloroflexota bacterium]|nr:GEVED domain-containing protein [Chloroflexota bacterium]